MKDTMQAGCVFERREKKYLLDTRQYCAFLNAAGAYLEEDAYGRYTICNVYYDTQDDALIRRSIEKPIYKEKLRLRSYGVPGADERVYLELKKKYRGVVYKRRAPMTLAEAERYLKTGLLTVPKTQIMREIDYFYRFYQPRAKLYLAYDRLALHGVQEQALRITFDDNIRSRTDALTLGAGDHGQPLLKAGFCLMEVKTAGAMPLWLARLLSELSAFPISFSKYGCIYRRAVARGHDAASVSAAAAFDYSA